MWPRTNPYVLHQSSTSADFPGIYELTWSMGTGPAGRATWSYGPERKRGAHIVWRAPHRHPRDPHQPLNASGAQAAGTPAVVAGAADQSPSFETAELVGDGAGAGQADPFADLPDGRALTGLRDPGPDRTQDRFPPGGQGIGPGHAARVPRCSWRWAGRLSSTRAAGVPARQYYEREGHLRVPRGHTERITTGNDSQDQEEQDLKLGSWISNQRSRTTTLSPERKKQLSEIGMRWT